MSLRARLKPGETWEDVIAEEIRKTIEYKGHGGCYPIPESTAWALVRIAYRGRGFGGNFTDAVLNNDLMDACCRADRENEKALHNIVKWLYNVAPPGMRRDPRYPGLILVMEGKAE